MLRLYPGDEFIFKLKGSETVHTSYVNNLSDTSVVTHRDTISFHSIERLYFRRDTFANRLGKKLVAAGVVFMLFDQLNVVVMQGAEPRLDNGVVSVSSIFVVAGLPMALIKKKSQKLSYKYKLLTAKKGSYFYKPDPTGFTSPFLEHD